MVSYLHFLFWSCKSFYFTTKDIVQKAMSFNYGSDIVDFSVEVSSYKFKGQILPNHLHAWYFEEYQACRVILNKNWAGSVICSILAVFLSSIGLVNNIYFCQRWYYFKKLKKWKDVDFHWLPPPPFVNPFYYKFS